MSERDTIRELAEDLERYVKVSESDALKSVFT